MKVASDPKELLIVGPDADHCDVYDQTDRIPFDLTAFFQQHLC